MYDLHNELKNKVICITGASGYIGSSLVKELDNHSIKKLIRVGRKKMKILPNIEDWVLDLKNYNSWRKIVKQADIIFHLSGNTSINSSENDPENEFISETLPITNLVKASKELNRNPRVIYASTATIYGLTDELPVKEEHFPIPITKYDSNKLHAEKHLIMASKENIIESISLRLANVYGPSVNESSSYDRGILSKITKLSFENKKIPMYGAGNYIRDYIYIDDVVNAFLLSSIYSHPSIPAPIIISLVDDSAAEIPLSHELSPLHLSFGSNRQLISPLIAFKE